MYDDFVPTCHIPWISYTEGKAKIGIVKRPKTNLTKVMLRAIATWIAKWKYVWNKETEAGMHTWSARVAQLNAKGTRDLISKLKNEADTYEARIKNVAEMEERGFLLCEDGHEDPDIPLMTEVERREILCAQCRKPAKIIKRDLMTGQEKYESDKGRKDAERMLAGRRQEITDKETEAAQQDATAKYFRTQAESGRKLADSLRKL